MALFLSGLDPNACDMRRLSFLSSSRLGLLLSSPLGRLGAVSSPNSVGVGGSSGSPLSPSDDWDSDVLLSSCSGAAPPKSNGD